MLYDINSYNVNRFAIALKKDITTNIFTRNLYDYVKVLDLSQASLGVETIPRYIRGASIKVFSNEAEMQKLISLVSYYVSSTLTIFNKCSQGDERNFV